MIRIRNFPGEKKPAQAMVEFAIALPVLLLMLYGILEAGRLLFLYSTVVTASRQAVRYGSATGEGNNGVPRYQDCDGIRSAANKVGYLGKFDAITLQYDKGVTNTNPPAPVDRKTYCTGSTDSSLNTEILQGNRTRLVVTVTKEFRPIVPKLVPFIQRNITASSARTILYSVPIVVEQEQQEWFKNPTTTVITLDTPDPSEIYQSVTVNVQVTGGSPQPTGVVDITGADQNCQITLNGSGAGSCNVIFNTQGAKVLVAFYEGDTDNLASSDAEDHTVMIMQTVTTITLDSPDPSTIAQPVAVAVTVTGGSSTPNGTVSVSAGGNVNCSFTLSMGMGSCALPAFNTLGVQTITATYSGDSLHLASSDTETHTVLAGTPTATVSPTITASPTITSSPTITITPTRTLTPTPIATAVPSCNGITAPSGITLSGNVMTITINNGNPYGFTLMLKDITVTWNSDKGHKSGTDKTLKLQKVTVGGTTVWLGNTTSESTKTIPTNATLPPGSTTISFYFHQSYDLIDGTESILLNWLTPGCEGHPITVK
ncbi:MAG TPA: Ig-like domain repeat protein [Anaerolineales bacterium]|nr:Ig-like domain repeat protein [Anaerolineales bacterium]